MKQLFQKVLETIEKGEDAAVITIIASSGSTPRGAGSRILVRADGSTEGTIGGGAVEHRAVEMAREAIENKISYAHGFVLGREETADLGMICGGNVAVYFQYIDHENHGFKALCRKIVQAFEKDEDSWILMDITDETVWSMGFYNQSGGFFGKVKLTDQEQDQLLVNKAVQLQFGPKKLYSEPLIRAGIVYIFGGGHVAKELVPVLDHVGFNCVVFDDRPEFANNEAFPQARTVVGDFERIFDFIDIKDSDYICIMSRGHQYDYMIQRQVLTRNPCYVGVMGSRKKLDTVAQKLKNDGVSAERIEGCHGPIGLEILAETPAEIAISVAGELIYTRALRGGRK